MGKKKKKKKNLIMTGQEFPGEIWTRLNICTNDSAWVYIYAASLHIERYRANDLLHSSYLFLFFFFNKWRGGFLKVYNIFFSLQHEVGVVIKK